MSKMASSAAALVVPAVKRHTSTVIVAHGLGDRQAATPPLQYIDTSMN